MSVIFLLAGNVTSAGWQPGR